MERLEISIINFKEIAESSPERRIEAEYYKKEFLNYENTIEKKKYTFLQDIADFLIGPFGSAFNTANYVEKSLFRYIRGQDVKAFILKSDDARYISEKDYKRLMRYALKENDILVSVVGTLGNACIVKKRDLPAIFSCKSTAIRVTNINPYYLLTYLNTKYGYSLLVRNERGAIQKGLNLRDLQSLIVPLFSDKFQNMIQAIIEKTYEKMDIASKQLKVAEKVFLKEIGMQDWSPRDEIYSVEYFKSIAERGRIDAEYYQNKYTELFCRLKACRCRSLDQLVKIKKSIEPGTEAYQNSGIPFYRVSNLSEYGLSKTDIFLDEQSFFKEELGLKADNILLSKDGSIGIAYKIEKNMKAMTSSAILHLEIESDEILPDYLTLVLNSNIVKMQAERDAGGSIIQHWRLDEIKKLIIPIIEKSIQVEICKLIQINFKLRSEVEQLFEKAKLAIEIAIEQDENKAIGFLSDIL